MSSQFLWVMAGGPSLEPLQVCRAGGTPLQVGGGL